METTDRNTKESETIQVFDGTNIDSKPSMECEKKLGQMDTNYDRFVCLKLK